MGHMLFQIKRSVAFEVCLDRVCIIDGRLVSVLCWVSDVLLDYGILSR